MNSLTQNRWTFLFCTALSALAYYLLGYEVPRQNFGQLVLLFSLAFACYWFLARKLDLKTGMLAALIFRLTFLFSLPALSDDYFRFLWDGRLFAAGENPFQHLPDFYRQNNFRGIPGLNLNLYAGLNSPHYFTVYPPVCQFIFALAGWLSPENNAVGVWLMRLFILAAEAGTLWLLPKLLGQFRLQKEKALWYALNPLVIVELTGNLHFEALMIFFTLGAFYLLGRKQYHFSALSLSLAVCSKLLPLMLLPFLIRHLGVKKGLVYCSLTGIGFLILFLPFLDSKLIAHFSNSLNLYFQKFEFNAGIYYLVRWLGFYLSGYNQIALIGPLLSAFVFVGVLLLAVFGKVQNTFSLLRYFMVALTLHFLLATVVHPWYLTTLVALGTLSNLRFPLVWSGLAILSYAAYKTNAYTENPWLLFLEYGGLFLALLVEKRYVSREKSRHIPLENQEKPEPVKA